MRFDLPDAANAAALGIALCVALHDLFAASVLRKRLPAWLNRVRSYFTDFLDFGDFQTSPSEELPKRAPSLGKARLLVFLAGVAVLANLFRLGVAIVENDASTFTCVSAILIWAYVLVRTVHRPLVTPPWGTLFLVVSQFALALIQGGAVLVSTNQNIGVLDFIWPIVRAIHAVLAFSIIASLPLMATLPSKNVSSLTDTPSSSLSSPEDAATLWSWMTFSHVRPLLKLAGKQTVRDNAVYDLPPSFKHQVLLNKYRSTYKEGRSLIVWLISASSMDLTIYIAGRVYNNAVGFVGAYTLKRILDALDTDVLGIAYLFAGVQFVTNLSFAQFDIISGWHSRRVYERTRGLLFCIVFEKTLRRRDPTGSNMDIDDQDGGHSSKRQKASADLGKVYNVMRNDSYAIAQRFWDGADIFVAPVGLIISFYFLYQVLGWSAFIGAGLSVISVAIQFPLGRYLAKLTTRAYNARDRSNSTVTELLSTLRFLKLSAWEQIFLGRVKDARNEALRRRVYQNVGMTGFSLILVTFPKAVLVLTFYVYTTWQKQQLTVSTAFVSISLFARLEASMLDLPNAILSYINAAVSVRRLQNFLDEPDVDDWVCSLTAPASDTAENGSIGFENATLEWHAKIRAQLGVSDMDKDVPFRLQNLDIAFKIGALNLVIGETASGKSSLLAGLLGEMDCIEGSVSCVKVGKNIAYCAQNAWLENKSIKENILFVTPYEHDRYQQTLKACALLPDLAVLDAGEETEIGERGVSLSGGQKARIALARAVYSHAATVLLDDPLAAVDSHTARSLVDQCLNGPLMKGRTIILVTHHVALCTRGDGYLVELEKGRVISQGSLKDLRAAGKLASITSRQDHTESEIEDVVDQNVSTNLSDLKDKKVIEKFAGKLTTVEDQAEGTVSMRTYLAYITACGSLLWIGVVFCHGAALIRSLGSQYFLQLWSNAYNSGRETIIGWIRLPPPAQDVHPWILTYLGISLLATVNSFLRSIFSIISQYRASHSLFDKLLYRISRSSFRWLDQTPRGRIMNRTVSDIATLDGTLFESLANSIVGILEFLISFGVILVLVPAFAPCALLIASGYIVIAPEFIKGSRGFDQMLHGLTTVRAYAVEHRYLSTACTDVDRFQRHDHIYWNMSFWLNYRYDVLGSVVVFATTVAALATGLRAGLVAVLIVQAESFADASRFLIKRFSQVQLDYNSMERISEYCNVPIEAPTESKNRPPAYWPSSSGGIVFSNFSARYSPSLPFVLRDINFEIGPRQKVGLVGRTGSGKSSMALCVLRALEASEGKILIDGVDIAHIGLHDLRKKVTLVSQDVVLFENDVRTNLDPLHEHSDAEIVDVLRRCYLISDSQISTDAEIRAKSTIAFTSLDDRVAADGASLSQGQRQLLALARALLRRSNILIMDEASSSIDHETDLMIQKTIRDELSETLTLTIAHRLHTVIDYDLIVVLDQGRVAELGSPKTLLEREGSSFREMCHQSSDWPALAKMAGIAA